MSAFALVVDFEAGPIDPVMLDRGERALNGFALRGWQRHIDSGLAVTQAIPRSGVAYARLGTLHVVVDGALSEHCAAGLALQLGWSASERAHLGDAGLIAACSAQVEDFTSFAAALQGDFAFALIDGSARTLRLIRSRVGSRALYHLRCGGQIVVATRAATALHTAGLALRERAESIAAYFALRAPAANACYFEGLQVVPPGHLQEWNSGLARDTELPAKPVDAALGFANADEAAAAWAAVLLGATAEALRGSSRAGVMLSGGIDSNLLAMFAAVEHPDLLACSWRLPLTPAADESAWIAQSTAALGLATLTMDGSTHYPLSRLDQWTVEDDGPPSNPYQQLHAQLFAGASAQGCDVLLTGNFGDHLYPDDARWLPSAIADRGLGWALRRYRADWSAHGITAVWTDPGWRTSVRGWLGRQALQWYAPRWLRASWRAELVAWLGVTLPDAGPRSAEASADAELGRRLPARYGVELRAPYRDAEVIDFARGLPAHYQYCELQQKYLSRRLLRQRLPEPLCQRPKGGNLGPFFRFGVLERAGPQVAALLDAGDARWPAYVERAALARARDRVKSETDLLLIWLCVSYELWWRAHWAEGPAVLSSEAS